jgi:hypothetical protein
MTKIAYTIALLSAMLILSYSAPAQARARVFVASYGNDVNPCTFGSPCKTFQQAVNVVDAAGEVTAIDSAGFGPINITKAVTITSPDGVEAGIVPNPGGDAIDINAGLSDSVVLRGLTLNGSGVGTNGIVFNSGGSLTVTNCVVENFIQTSGNTGNGILIQPSATNLVGINFAITNTTAVNNRNVGIFYVPQNLNGSPVFGVIDHVTATYNGFGIAVSPSGPGSTTITISNSNASNGSFNGISGTNSNGAALILSIDNVTTSGNGYGGVVGVGIDFGGTANVLLGRSVITGNYAGGITNNTSPNTFYTYGNNQINLNRGGDINGTPLLTTFTPR